MSKRGSVHEKAALFSWTKSPLIPGDICPVSASVQVFTKPSVLLNRFRAVARPVRMEDCPMFPDTDLPLALIMEEILGLEKKPDSDKDDEKE